ncbi:MAG TPA: serine/threonine-protein kinase, partial [Gammaproteobacteria bacterium]|nr:serine/threonine-protein kinase [Gammaproteobacteria bacterium]
MPELVKVDRYAIQRSLGAGGIGLVYEAIDSDSGAHVAIKTLRDVTPDGLYRLKREFRLLQGVEHPNVCQIYELFEHDGRWFITMELVDGTSLLEYMRGDEERLRDAMAQLALALCAVHEAELVHRDLKPSNVLVTDEGRVVLLDFGFVEDTAKEASPTRSQSIVGTPMYMAPEQALAADAGPAADWYSFGVILFEALTGRLPFDGETALAVMLEKQRTDAPRASAIVPGVPADLDELCADLLRIDPARRPSGSSVLRRLGARSSARDSRPALASVPSVSGGFVGRSSELAQLRSAFNELGEV